MTLTQRAPLRAVFAVLVVAVLLVAAINWFTERDERRIGAACETWLKNRDGLRTVLSESEEAVGRAEASGQQDVGKHFNNLDSTVAALEEWEALGPGTQGRLHGDGDASSFERGAESAFGVLNKGVHQLHELIDDGNPSELADWLPEAQARFQNVDDICGVAWRSL